MRYDHESEETCCAQLVMITSCSHLVDDVFVLAQPPSVRFVVEQLHTKSNQWSLSHTVHINCVRWPCALIEKVKQYTLTRLYWPVLLALLIPSSDITKHTQTFSATVGVCLHLCPHTLLTGSGQKRRERGKRSFFARTHLLLAGNDTVPISTWRGWAVHSSRLSRV